MNLTTDQLTCRAPQNTDQPPTGPAVSVTDLDSDNVIDLDSDDVIRLDSAQLTAVGDTVQLRWRVDPGLSPYRCEQVALASRTESAQPCGAVDLADPTLLQVALRAAGLEAGERYQFCVTLVELTPGVELGLAPVCRWIQLAGASAVLPRLDKLSAEVTSVGRVKARVKLSPPENRPPDDCAVAHSRPGTSRAPLRRGIILHSAAGHPVGSHRRGISQSLLF